MWSLFKSKKEKELEELRDENLKLTSECAHIRMLRDDFLWLINEAICPRSEYDKLVGDKPNKKEYMVHYITPNQPDDKENVATIYFGDDSYIYIPASIRGEYTNVAINISYATGKCYLFLNSYGAGLSIDSNNRLKCKALMDYIRKIYGPLSNGKNYLCLKPFLGE